MVLYMLVQRCMIYFIHIFYKSLLQGDVYHHVRTFSPVFVEFLTLYFGRELTIIGPSWEHRIVLLQVKVACTTFIYSDAGHC